MGNPHNVVARSSWERADFIWCEKNPKILKWASESVNIPYINPLDKKQHKYVMDLLIWWEDGTIEMVEIKPKRQTNKPLYPGRKTKKYLEEAVEYVKNQSKWKSANAYAQARGWKFSIWHEEIMKAKGIKIV